MKFRNFLTGSMLILGSAVLFAQDANWKLELSSNRPNGIYKTGEEIVYTAKLSIPAGTKTDDMRIFYYTYLNGGHDKAEYFPLKEETSIKVKLNAPGWTNTLVHVQKKSADGKKWEQYTYTDDKGKKQKLMRQIGVMADPLAIRQGAPEPEDFDAFWDAEKAKLAKVPANVKETPMPGQWHNRRDFFLTADVGSGFRGVNAIVHIPTNVKAKSVPILLFVHGAGVHVVTKQTWRWEHGPASNFGYKGPCIFINMNAHGIPNDQPPEYYKNLDKGELANYRYFNNGDPDKYYMKGVILRLIRVLQIAKTFPEWDGKNIFVRGASQGGGQSLYAAGIDPDVTHIFADVPAMCDHGGSIADHSPGWPKLYYLQKDGSFKKNMADGVKAKLVPSDKSIVKACGYYDAANFAKRIKANVLIQTGGADGVCPPSSVFAAYNNIRSPKALNFSTLGGHCQGIYTDYGTQKVAHFVGGRLLP